MKILIVRHAQSENNIVQAEAHISMSRGEITPEAAQVSYTCAVQNFSFLFSVYRLNGLRVDLMIRDFLRLV